MWKSQIIVSADRPFSININFPGLQNKPFMPFWARANDFSGVPRDWMARFIAMFYVF